MSKNSINTRQKILITAQDLMQEKGFNGVSIDDVATKAEVSKGNVTYYFPTKSDLTKAALESNSYNRDEAYSLIYDAKSLDEFFAECIAMAKSQKSASCLLGTVSQESNGLNKDLQLKCSELFNSWEERLIDTFRNILPGVSKHEELAKLFLSQLQGALLLSKTHKDSNILISNLETLHQMMKKII